MRNYLARLGWSHGDDEFFTDAQAQEWFDLDGIGKSPARFDFKKLDNLSGSISPPRRMLRCCMSWKHSCRTGKPPVTDAQRTLLEGMYCLKERAKSYPELIDKAEFILASRPIEPDEKAAKAWMMYPVVYCFN
jgi:glutamyl-tRNA synthetase